MSKNQLAQLMISFGSCPQKSQSSHSQWTSGPGAKCHQALSVGLRLADTASAAVRCTPLPGAATWGPEESCCRMTAGHSCSGHQLTARVKCTAATAPWQWKGRRFPPPHLSEADQAACRSAVGLMDAVQLPSLLPALLACSPRHQMRSACNRRKSGLQGCNRGGVSVQVVLLPCRWFEVDQLEVIQYKQRLLKSAGAAIRVRHAQRVSSN